MKLPMIFKSTLIAVLLTSSNAAMAGDGNLYRDVFEPNSSFIRVIAPGQNIASVDSKNFNDMGDGLSAFKNVMPGETTVSLTGNSTTFAVEPNVHYTVLLNPDEQLIVVKDKIMSSPSKADVTFYNTTTLDGLELYVPAAKASIFKNVAAASGATMAIKAPLTLDFDIRKDGESLAVAEKIELQRKAGVTILLIETDEGLEAIASPNSYLK